VITLDCPDTSQCGYGSRPGPEFREYPGLAWKMDPVLELWVNVETTPVTVRLAGILDELTCVSVVPIIEDLLAEGHREFAMQIEEVKPLCASGYASLVRIVLLVTRARGSVSWSSSPEHVLISDHGTPGSALCFGG
jgi:hypothetical protein